MIGIGMVVALVSAGCSGGGDGGGGGSPPGADAASHVNIGGWYRVTSDLDGPCGGMLKPVAAILSPPYLRLEARTSSGFILRTCRSQVESDCPGTRYYDFTTPITDGWSAEGGTAFFSAGCTLVWERTTAILNGSELRISSRSNEVHRDVPQSQCNLAAAEAVTECKSEDAMTATRL
jgi:hypothetical protein